MSESELEALRELAARGDADAIGQLIELAAERKTSTNCGAWPRTAAAGMLPTSLLNSPPKSRTWTSSGGWPPAATVTPPTFWRSSRTRAPPTTNSGPPGRCTAALPGASMRPERAGQALADDLEVEHGCAECAPRRSHTGITSPRAAGGRQVAEVEDVASRTSSAARRRCLGIGVVAGNEDGVSAPPSCPGSTMRSALSVLRDFTTWAPGKARWICSASESVSLTNRVGGKPPAEVEGVGQCQGSPCRPGCPRRPGPEQPGVRRRWWR